MKQLVKSQTDKQISGVLAGFGDYYKVDANLLRIGYVVVTVITGFFPCLVLYLAGVFLMPNKVNPDKEQLEDDKYR